MQSRSVAKSCALCMIETFATKAPETTLTEVPYYGGTKHIFCRSSKKPP